MTARLLRLVHPQDRVGRRRRRGVRRHIRKVAAPILGKAPEEAVPSARADRTHPATPRTHPPPPPRALTAPASAAPTARAPHPHTHTPAAPLPVERSPAFFFLRRRESRPRGVRYARRGEHDHSGDHRCSGAAVWFVHVLACAGPVLLCCLRGSVAPTSTPSTPPTHTHTPSHTHTPPRSLHPPPPTSTTPSTPPHPHLGADRTSRW